MTSILGISAFYHDSAAAIIVDGKILAAAQEERFTRNKHDPGFPSNAIQYCLKEANIDSSQVDNVVFYEKPFTLVFDSLGLVFNFKYVKVCLRRVSSYKYSYICLRGIFY